MDSLDRRLLNLLQRDSGRTAKQLAEQVPLSATAITRRLQRMRAEGSIEREVALVPVKLRERRITAVIQVQFERHTPSELLELKKMLAAAPEVLICVAITGANDMMIITSTRDMDHFNEFADQLAVQPLVRRYESSFVKRHIKMSLAIGLDED
jgi:Lrp/AsnC family leucine-responsive transcriptional regulator